MIMFLFTAVGVLLLAAVLALVYAHGLQVALNDERQKNARQEMMIAHRRQDIGEATEEIAFLRGQLADREGRIAALAARVDRDSLELERLDGLIAEAAEVLAEGGGS